MDDFAYLFQDSTGAWLTGGGDRRFDTYERRYQLARAAEAAEFDLERFNEECVNGMQKKSYRIARVISHPVVAKFSIACFIIWGTGHIVPSLAAKNPTGTGFALAVAFFGLRIFHRRLRH